MKSLRSLATPTLCFALAWGTAWFAGKHFAKPCAGPVAPPPAGPTKVLRERPDATRTSVAKLVEDFRRQPMDEWAGRWEAFARDATVDDLTKLSQRTSERWDGQRIEADDLVQVLASEELAVRTGIPVANSPASFAALAEADPEAAWKGLAGSYATSALRVLAGKDPEETLRRYQPLSAGSWRSLGNGSAGADGAVSQGPLGAIFGAWARRDPLAAAAAVKTLPPSERTAAANHLAITWAFRDGPAAIRYLLDFDKTGEGFTNHSLRLDVVLRASFRTHPAETARLMRESPMLRRMIGKHPNNSVAFGPWQDADLAGVIDWIREKPVGDDHRSDHLLRVSRKPNPAAILRAAFSAGIPLNPEHLTSLYLRDPELARSLADEFGIPLRDHPRLEELRVRIHPADACDRWLEALREHDDPAAAMAALGWDGNTAITLAGLAARVFPDKAAELAKRVPASSFDGPLLWYLKQNPAAVRLWPELAGNPPATPAAPPFPTMLFRYDPAAAAEGLLVTGPDARQVKQAVELWAPYDPDAARAWLLRLPEGPARQEGQLALAGIQANSDPVATLETLVSSGQPDRSGWISRTALRRLLYTGGDWKGWLARLPDDWQAHQVAEEAKLLDHLRQTRPR